MSKQRLVEPSMNKLVPLPVSSNGGSWDMFRALLLMIFHLQQQLLMCLLIIYQQQKELTEKEVSLHKIKGVFSPKNDQVDHPKEEENPSPKKKRGAQKGHKAQGRKIPKGLKEEAVEVDFDETPQCCECGTPYKRIKIFDKVSHQIKVVFEGIHQVITRLSYKQNCSCAGVPTVITAPQKPSVIKKSILTTTTWVHLIMMKYLLAVPIYRYRKAMEPSGFILSPGTVENGFRKIGTLLQPIYQRMQEELKKSPHFNADETRWKVFEQIEGKKSFLWWLWVFASKKIVLYVIDPTRSTEVIKKIYDQTTKIISADRYSVYESMSKRYGVLIAYCWVHLRRDFLQLQKIKQFSPDSEVGKWIEEWLSSIRHLYHLNKKRLETSSDTEHEELTAQLRSITEKLYQQETESLSFDCQKKILISFKKRFEGYTIFIDHPLIPMDNNRAEQLLKIAISGRNNYLGNVSQESVMHTQIYLSIISTAKINHVDPQKWLQDYLDDCAKNDSKPLQGEALEFHFKKLINCSS